MEDLFVNRVRLNKESIETNKYPFNIKCLKDFEELKIDNAVTLFYGENGVGKSTIIIRYPIIYKIPTRVYNIFGGKE